MLVSISDFAREHGVEPQAVSRWLNRHEELQKQLIEDGKKKLIDRDGELYRILEEQYPYPKPTVIINGLDQDAERELRERLQKAQELIIQMQNELTDQKLLNAKHEADKKLLEDREKRYEEDMQKLTTELEAERAKTWWQKLTGK